MTANNAINEVLETNAILSEKIMKNMKDLTRDQLVYHINQLATLEVAILPDEPTPKQKEWLIVAKKRLASFAL